MHTLLCNYHISAQIYVCMTYHMMHACSPCIVHVVRTVQTSDPCIASYLHLISAALQIKYSESFINVHIYGYLYTRIWKTKRLDRLQFIVTRCDDFLCLRLAQWPRFYSLQNLLHCSELYYCWGESKIVLLLVLINKCTIAGIYQSSTEPLHTHHALHLRLGLCTPCQYFLLELLVARV